MKPHETKEEFFKREPKLAKFLYYIGALKLISYKKSYDLVLRRVHPFTWVLVVLGVIMNGLNKDTFTGIWKEIKKDTVWF